MSAQTQARVRRQLDQTLRDMQRCSHFSAAATGPSEGLAQADGRWSYTTPYRCPDCGAHFVETHHQSVERNAVD